MQCTLVFINPPQTAPDSHRHFLSPLKDHKLHNRINGCAFSLPFTDLLQFLVPHNTFSTKKAIHALILPLYGPFLSRLIQWPEAKAAWKPLPSHIIVLPSLHTHTAIMCPYTCRPRKKGKTSERCVLAQPLLGTKPLPRRWRQRTLQKEIVECAS